MKDTSPDAENAQIVLLRSLSVAERANKAGQLSTATRALSFRAIRRQFPDLSEDEIRLKFIELHYGRILADEVRVYIHACRT